MRGKSRLLLALAPTLSVLFVASGVWAGPQEDSELVDAAAYGDENRVRTAYLQGANINGRNSSGLGALHAAAAGKNQAVAEFLLANGARINDRDGSGDTPLHKAINYGQLAMIDLLLARGADITMPDGKGRLPLTLALANTTNRIDDTTRTEMAVVLIDHGAPLGSRDREGQTLLQNAVEAGSLGTAKLLLEHAASVDSAYPDKRTPLHVATVAGNASMVRLLLEYGAAVDRLTPGGDRALHTAIRAGNFNLVTTLIEGGANIDSLPSPLHERLLEPIGVDEELFVHFAARRLDTRSLELALSLGLSVHATTGGKRIAGRTPLHMAVSSNAAPAARLLLERGARVDAHSGDSYTPLGLAAEKGYEQMVTLLLEHGADPNLRAGPDEMTALHLVAYGPGWLMPRDEQRRAVLVRLLVEAGADKTVTNYAGDTAYDISLRKGDKEVPGLLAN
jgi:ankyrin repeat protein